MSLLEEEASPFTRRQLSKLFVECTVWCNLSTPNNIPSKLVTGQSNLSLTLLYEMHKHTDTVHITTSEHILI